MAKSSTSGQGRPAGALNKATSEIKDVARIHGPGAIKRLAELAGLIEGKSGASSEQAQVAASKELLDRGYGKPAQTVEATHSGGLTIKWES